MDGRREGLWDIAKTYFFARFSEEGVSVQKKG